MKNGIIFCLLILVFTGHSQIPNGSFESWTGNKPTGWWSYSNPPATPYTCETLTSSACAGSLALKSSFVYPGTNSLALESGITTGSPSTGHFIPINVKPTKLSGCYLLNGGADTFAVYVWMKALGNVIGYGKFTAQTTTTVYTQFTVNINYSLAAIPDSFRVAISFNQPGSSVVSGSSFGQYFMVDDLNFDVISGLSARTNSTFQFNVFPNPASEQLVVETEDEAEIEIRTVQGMLLYKGKTPEQGKKFIGLQGFDPGLYFVSVRTAGGFCGTRSFIVCP